MKTNNGIILVLAYPETIVRVTDEWYSKFLPYAGIGTKNFVKAGHAALVLVDRESGNLDYFDFGRYVVPQGFARVRSRDTDHELKFDIKAKMINKKIENLDEILKFFGTNPKLTHGEGPLVASVCKEVDYNKAKNYIQSLQKKDFIRYGAFIKNASNCSRFVTDTLIASVTNETIKRRLLKSKRFTPSTVSNVIHADTENNVYEITEGGQINGYNRSVWNTNKKNFLDRLKHFEPNFIGNLQPNPNDVINGQAQWLGGIGAGAWFELHKTESISKYRFRRISPYGNVDCDMHYSISDTSFSYEMKYQFVHYSNCKFFHIEQNNQIYRFDMLDIN